MLCVTIIRLIILFLHGKGNMQLAWTFFYHELIKKTSFFKFICCMFCIFYGQNNIINSFLPIIGLALGGVSQSKLRQASVPIVSHAKCTSADWLSGRVTTDMLCAGHEAGGEDSCQVRVLNQFVSCSTRNSKLTCNVYMLKTYVLYLKEFAGLFWSLTLWDHLLSLSDVILTNLSYFPGLKAGQI